MRSGEIRALTGLRIIAALWVVLFHFRPLLQTASPALDNALAPVISCGAQGVDLFFILSGFVLALNYLDRMGERWTLRGTVRFLWLRLARVWPVYVVMLHVAGAWIVFTHLVGHVPSPQLSQLTAGSYVQQLFMVQLWSAPYLDNTSWDGPAWSLSAEWLAYLVFPVLVLALLRMQRVTRSRGLLWLAFAASLPPVLLLAGTGEFYTPFSWLLRILMQFTAGALACVAVRRLDITDRTRRIAGWLALLMLAAIVGGLYLIAHHPVPRIQDDGGLIDVLFLPLVVALSVGSGALTRLLSTRLLVYGGQISFSLYLVHEFVQAAWQWVLPQFGLTIPPLAGKFVLLGLLVISVLLAMLLFHRVEEPARRWMRRMLDRPAEGPSPGVAAPGDAARTGDATADRRAEPRRPEARSAVTTG